MLKKSTEPSTKEIRDHLVKSWLRHPAFQDKEWPMWARMGFASFEQFADFWTDRLDPSVPSGPGAWACQAIRHTYTVRMPLVEDGTLICDDHPLRERGQQTLNIDYNDQRIFGHASFVPSHFAQRIDR